MKKVLKTRLPVLVKAIGLAAALSLGFASSAGAVTITQGLTSGVLNTVEDQDREAYIDANNDGLISVGDVFIGFVRIDNFLPKGADSNNQVYGIISNQIIGFNPADATQVMLGTTTVAGLRLQDITGDANAAGGLVAVYDQNAALGTNLINMSAPGATGIKDDIDYILATGTLRLVTGLGAAGDTYLTADVVAGFGVGSPNGIFATLPVSVGFGSFGGGLDITYNNTPYTYLDQVITLDPITGLHQTQLGIANGAFRGAVGDGNEGVFTNASGYGGFAQCTPGADQQAVPCGFATDADFFVFPVPEPGSLALLGVALLGLGGMRRRFTKKA